MVKEFHFALLHQYHPKPVKAHSPVPCLKPHVQKSVCFVQHQDVEGPHTAGQIQALCLPPEHVLQAAWSGHNDVPALKTQKTFITLSGSWEYLWFQIPSFVNLSPQSHLSSNKGKYSHEWEDRAQGREVRAVRKADGFRAKSQGGVSTRWPTGHIWPATVSVTSYWHTIMPIRSCIVSGGFHTPTVELNTWDKPCGPQT